jgi:uncharacterized membrane protein
MNLFSIDTIACISCNKAIRDGIYNSTFYPNLLIMMSAFFVLGIIVIILSSFSRKRYIKMSDPESSDSPVPLTTASIVLGIGIGGFIDGIFLHQILQWHEMLSNKIPTNEYVGKSINMFWDGIFHFFCLLVISTGVVLLWKLLKTKNINVSKYLLMGGLLQGWGLFNLVEGLIDHHILKLHNVIELSPNHDIGNSIFIGSSIIFILLGSWMVKNGKVQVVQY